MCSNPCFPCCAQDKELDEIEAAYEREAAEKAAAKEKEEAEKEAAFANTKEGKLKKITDEITELYKTCQPEKLEELPGKLEKYQVSWIIAGAGELEGPRIRASKTPLALSHILNHPPSSSSSSSSSSLSSSSLW